MDKYFEADKQLAELLYSKEYELRVVDETIQLHHNGPEYSYWWSDAPRWTQDSGAAFDLQVEHEVSPTMTPFDIEVMWKVRAGGYMWRYEAYENHPDKTTAIRYAIVLAVIEKLRKEAEK